MLFLRTETDATAQSVDMPCLVYKQLFLSPNTACIDEMNICQGAQLWML